MDLHPLGECSPEHPDLMAAVSQHHFLAVSQDAHSLSVAAVDVNGEIFDEYAIKFP